MFKDKKKKALIPLVLFVAVCVVVLGIVSAYPYDRPTKNLSNSFGNAMNGAFVARDGSLDYYIDKEGTLRCQGGGDVYRISDSAKDVFPYVNNVVYVSLNQLRFSHFTGGTSYVLAEDVDSAQVGGNWAFYSRKGELYKMRIKDKKEMKMNITAKQFAVCGNYTYFIGEDDYLYYARNDGSNKEQFLNRKMKSFMLFDDYVFFIDSEGALRRTVTGNAAYEMVLLERCDSFIVSDVGMLLYLVDNRFYYWDLTAEGTQPHEVKGEFGEISGLNCLGDDFYYYDNGVLFKMKADGSERTEVA